MEAPREPMPTDWKPVWKFMGWMLLIVLSMGLVAAVIDLIVQK